MPASRQRAGGAAKPVKGKPAKETKDGENSKDSKKADTPAGPAGANLVAAPAAARVKPQGETAMTAELADEVTVSGPDPAQLADDFSPPDSAAAVIPAETAVVAAATAPPVAPASIPEAAAAGTDAVTQALPASNEEASAPVAAPSTAAIPSVKAQTPIETTPNTPDTPPAKEAITDPKAETAAKAGAVFSRPQIPQAATPSVQHGEPSSKGAESAADGSQAKAPNVHAASPANTADTRPELPAVSAPEASAARAAADTAPNPGTLPAAPAAIAASPAAAHIAQTPASPGGPAVAVPVEGLAVEIAARAQAGKHHFQIRLDPPELGRIDVRLDVDREGNVTSRLVVERAETLDLLRRDAANLERAFQQAGLKTSDNGLQFSLRDQASYGRDDGDRAPDMARLVVPDDKLVAAEMQRNYGRPAGFGGGVDIRV
ncbi:MAG: flagellar hook-length control protein FliK [Xanthobacteraceae bacterium]